MRYIFLPDGLPWMIFSDLKAHLQMTYLSASSSSDLRLRPFCKWNKAPAKATEKAAELPKPVLKNLWVRGLLQTLNLGLSVYISGVFSWGRP